jgi:hypothetical protein
MTTKADYHRNTKTYRDALILVKLLRGHFINVSGFEVAEISKHMKQHNVNNNVFYHLASAGFLTKITRGVYSVNRNDFFALEDREIANRVDKESIKVRQKLREAIKVKSNANTKANAMDFDRAVQIIKAMGGKVLMPTSEYKEV